MLLKLSRFVPVRMRSTYGVLSDPREPSRDGTRERSTWWQFRGRIFRHRRLVVLKEN